MRFIGAAAWLVGGGFWAIGACAPLPMQAAPTTVVKGPLKQGPLNYFQANCAHCHGPFGDAYTDHFYGITDFDKLRADVKRMCDGPGQAPLEGNDLVAQVDYHKALIAKGPFISWTDDGPTLGGEVTRGAVLTAEAAGKPLTVTVKKWHWTLELPSGVSADAVTLSATLDKKQTSLKLAAAPWSTKIVEQK